MIKGKIPMDTAFIGALSLDGMVVKADGMLPALISAKGLGLKKIYLPYDPTIPLHMLKDLDCIVVQHIEEVVQHLEGQELLQFHPNLTPNNQMPLFNSGCLVTTRYMSRIVESEYYSRVRSKGFHLGKFKRKQ